MTGVQTYEPRGGARDVMLSREPVVLVSGAAGTGKSLACLWKVHLTALQVPGSRQLILRQVHAALTASTLVTFEKQIIGPTLESGEVVWFGGSGREPPAYKYRNGSAVLVGGLDKPGKLLSTEYDRVFVDEADQVSAAAVQVIATRLRGKAATYRQLMMACNPAHPDHHLYQMALEGRCRHITSLHADNPYLVGRDGVRTEAGVEYFRFLEGLTGTARERYLYGRWVAAEGVVFDPWRDNVNVIDRDQVPEPVRIVWSIDFGYSNPFVWQEWFIDADGRAYLMREIHQVQTLVEDHARRIKELTGYRPDVIVCDHDAEDRATLTRHLGFATVAARKGVSRGLQLMNARIRPAGDGKPRLYVVRDSLVGKDTVAEAQKRPRGFLGEVNGYVWETVRGEDGIPKEQPVKLNDHSMDAARYLVAHLDWNEPVKASSPAKTQQAVSSRSSMWSRPVGR